MRCCVDTGTSSLRERNDWSERSKCGHPETKMHVVHYHDPLRSNASEDIVRSYRLPCQNVGANMLTTLCGRRPLFARQRLHAEGQTSIGAQGLVVRRRAKRNLPAVGRLNETRCEGRGGFGQRRIKCSKQKVRSAHRQALPVPHRWGCRREGPNHGQKTREHCARLASLNPALQTLLRQA